MAGSEFRTGYPTHASLQQWDWSTLIVKFKLSARL